MQIVGKGVMATGFLCAALALAADALAEGQDEVVTSSRTVIVLTESVEGAAVRGWIARYSPDYLPQLNAETVEVTRTVRIQDGAAQRMPGDSTRCPPAREWQAG